MPKARSPDRDKAFEIYKEHGGGIDLIDIASALNLPAGTIRGWKNKDHWEQKLNGALRKNTERSKRKEGAQPGNKNAVGNGAPPENKNAEKHGFFSKYLPEETFAIIQQLDSKPPLDILWENIQIAYAAIIRAQNIMYVADKTDSTTSKIAESNGDTSSSEKWEVQQAWDKQANFLKAQSRAQSELRGLIRQYDEMLHKNWDMATEEQRARIDLMKAKVGGTGNADATNNLLEQIRQSTKTGDDNAV